MRDAALDPIHHSGRGNARPRTSGAPPLESMLGEGVGPRGPKPKSRAGAVSSAAVAAQRLGGDRALGGARGRAGPGLVSGLRARLPRIRPLRTLTIAAFGIALVGIVANAMVFQRGHHPAPLLGLGQSIDGQPEAAPRAVAVTAPPPAVVPADPTGTVAPAPPPVVAAAPTPPAPAPKLAPTHHAVVKPHRVDGIGSLLAGTAPAGSNHPRPGTTATVAARQPAPRPVKAVPHPDTAHQVTAADAKAHPRPHAPDKAQAGAEPAAKAATKSE